ncbi:unnamed protein product [Haemonchus placei]|uniref:XPGI domain-containing protein n=1 Tax=Haemonchus placei TaxID=6290 RepID=A0A0N4W6E9_HAEPC|nr:unnamed protein product [Haemonchus placei]
MGIAGLWPLLEPTCQPVTLETLEGKILAVDVSIWIYQAQLGYPGEVRCPHLALLVSRMCKLLYYKIRPVFVFDGEGVPSFKSKVLNERRLKKHTEDIVLTHAKKRTLLDLATSRFRISVLFPFYFSCSNYFDHFIVMNYSEVVDLSDDDEDIVVVDAKKEEPSSRTIDILMDERERIRNSRLRPSQIPSDSKSFSQFQLERLLCRSRLNTHIKQVPHGRSNRRYDSEMNSNARAYVKSRINYADELTFDFLTACGFPWIEAPGEAEAQCVELENLGLVQGVISDDSDVWAFGVKNVYRHLFSKNKNVQHYDSSTKLSCEFHLADFVGLAVLSGGDYSSGLAGVGIVNAVELLSEFAETLSTLGNVEKWMATFDSTEDPPEPIALRRKLRAIIKKNNDMERIKSIVNPDVVAAYFRPNVDKSREKFRWKKVDMERVRAILYSKLGWDDDKFNKQTLTPLQRWNDFITGGASYQRHITSFTHKLQQSPDEQRVTLTKRVETALANLAKRTGNTVLRTNIFSLNTYSKRKFVCEFTKNI